MEINSLYAEINTPEALKGEHLFGLPPYDKRPAYLVDEYSSCPSNWMHGSSKASSYFIPISAQRGMWFDFTKNTSNLYDVAIVISVQGINPITGKKITELNLEQYKEKCPVHNIDFQQNRYCHKCEYIWPAQNYISTTSGQPLWIDGFRNENGEVRQYIITEDMTRGIAAQIVGDDRVWAIGFAFYLSKKPKSSKLHYFEPLHHGCLFNAQNQTLLKSCSIPICTRKIDVYNNKTLEIGAGAKIRQEIGVDLNQIDYWQTEPTGLIYVSYCDEEFCSKILKTGKRIDKKDSALSGLKIGN